MRSTRKWVARGAAAVLSGLLALSLAPFPALAEEEESLAFNADAVAAPSRRDEVVAEFGEPAGAPEVEFEDTYVEGDLANLIPVGQLQEELGIPETEEAMGAYEGEEGEDPSGSSYNWARIAGNNALKTMQKVVRTHEIFINKGTRSVIIATAGNYKDALSAAGLAGNLRGPILITNGKSLSAETKAEIAHINPEYIAIVGGTGVITPKVESQLKALRRSDGSRYTVDRAWGRNSALTSLYIYRSLSASKWGDYAFICTGNNYKDALSCAPYAYWAGCPIFLVNTSKSLDKRVLDSKIVSAIANGGFKKVIIMGGPKAITARVETQLKNAGLHISGSNENVYRCYGSDALGTSAYTAQWELSEGMNQSHLTVATTSSYKDALCSVSVAAECDSVMVLCNPYGGLSAFNKIYDSYEVTHGHVIGGPNAISASNYNSIINHY